MRFTNQPELQALTDYRHGMYQGDNPYECGTPEALLWELTLQQCLDTENDLNEAYSSDSAFDYEPSTLGE